MCNWLKISQIIYNFAAGFGLLFAGIAGFKLLLNWISDSIEKNKFEKITKELKKKYPEKDQGITFELAKVKGHRPVYIIDKKEKIRIWIDTPVRLYDLFVLPRINDVTQADLDTYREERKFY